MKPGAPPGGSTWNLVELRLGLNLETRRTAAVDEAPYRRGHANAAYGTVADIYVYRSHSNLRDVLGFQIFGIIFN